MTIEPGKISQIQRLMSIRAILNNFSGRSNFAFWSWGDFAPSWSHPLMGTHWGTAWRSREEKRTRTPLVSLDLATAGRTGPPVGMPLFYRMSQEPRRKEMLSHPTQLQGYWSCYSACEGVLERSSLCRLELNGSPQLVQCGF